MILMTMILMDEPPLMLHYLGLDSFVHSTIVSGSLEYLATLASP